MALATDPPMTACCRGFLAKDLCSFFFSRLLIYEVIYWVILGSGFFAKTLGSFFTAAFTGATTAFGATTTFGAYATALGSSTGFF